MIIEKKRRTKNSRIVVAISGGVDSSVAAALLKKKNYDVVGIFLKFWSPYAKAASDKTTRRENICCNQEALFSARQVAAKLEIPFYVLDVSKEFKREVVDYYIREYENGRTPNPCVVCNKKIKFGWLMEKAKELGAKYLATGHYARIKNNKLLKAKDKKKDQTYFLWQLSQDQLKHILFPIGDYTKQEVRALAKKFGLHVAEKRESQDICFIEKGKNNDFLAHYARKLLKPGKIVDSKGKLLGIHKGSVFYTLGQRHGLTGIQLKRQTGGFEPAYVIKLEPGKNRVIIGSKRDLYNNKLEVKNINLLSKWPTVLACQASIRYGHPAESCRITKLLNCRQIKVVFDKPQCAITPGQSIVFYKGNEVIGGGIIK